MLIHYKLTKRCKGTDRYDQCDEQGNEIKDPTVGAIYIKKDVYNGAERITITLNK